MAAPLINLRAGPLSVHVAPDIGGSIVRFEYHGAGAAVPILRKPETDRAAVTEMACFPLVPFANRIRGGRIQTGSGEVHLKQRIADEPFPLHGSGWLAPWRVEWADEWSALLEYRHEAADWPWSFVAHQFIDLDERGLSLRLVCRNESAAAMPCGLGLHPFFHAGPATRLDSIVRGAWAVDDLHLPTEKVAAENQYGLRHRHILSQGLNNCFEGWEGVALISDPTRPFTIRLSADGATFLQVYSPRGEDFFAVEPVTHTPAAFDYAAAKWGEFGLVSLAPGDGLSLAMRIELVGIRREPRKNGAGLRPANTGASSGRSARS